MSENDKGKRPPPDDDGIGELIRSAGRRKGIPPAELAAMEETATAAWREMVRTERRHRIVKRGAYALAATVVLAVVGIIWWERGGTPLDVEVATIERSSGRIEAVREPGESFDTGFGGKIRTGVLLKTVRGAGELAGRLALRMDGGRSVRLDTGTRVRFISGSRIELQQGAVYVDSGPSVSADSDLEIVTWLGVVREIGTQYEVRVGDDVETLQVRVREGQVSLSRDGESHTVEAGERLELRSDGAVSRETVTASGPAWAWVLESAPVFRIEGRSLESYLDWVSRETGWEIRYADADLEQSAQGIVLHGAIEDLRPDESLPVILQGSGLDHRIENATVTIINP